MLKSKLASILEDEGLIKKSASIPFDFLQEAFNKNPVDWEKVKGKLGVDVNKANLSFGAPVLSKTEWLGWDGSLSCRHPNHRYGAVLSPISC